MNKNLLYAHVPNWFKAALTEVRKGQRTYKDIGYHIALHIGGLMSTFERSDFKDDWNEVKNVKDGFRWCNRYIDYVLKFIPRQRRNSFISGMIECSNEGRMNF